jgi:hypothetical protein
MGKGVEVTSLLTAVFGADLNEPDALNAARQFWITGAKNIRCARNPAPMRVYALVTSQ